MRIKTLLKRLFFYFYKAAIKLFRIHVLPAHYYCPLPNPIELERTRHTWAHPSEMLGIEINLENQLKNLQKVCSPFHKEYLGNSTYLYAVKNKFGPGYGYIEAQALHAMIRFLQPKRIIEVGSGVSTYCMLKAACKNYDNNGIKTEIIAIEPNPSSMLKSMSEIQLIPRKVQEIDLKLFETLEKNDLLFIDSSHAVRAGGDVNFLILEVLPRLKSGVYVHFHDIYFPYDYPRDILTTFFPATESSLLHAFLIFNYKFEIFFCLSLLHYMCPNELAKVFPEYQPQGGNNGLNDENLTPFGTPIGHFPSSIYLFVKKDNKV
ncbi:class I SAM-dependent methyltransferase [Methylacidiphilum kamchatkense]|uniref:Methyltransferase family protein n=1 Tax=Methylacidiphilum kamchatkense Kam1 TaxID=1202785 RepID=A0A516TNS8_9BACT|nr:class I SAM-dependent methyltransferase [Methylacidiphilum kamchatkense]QDQ42899.1 methyltransferase family protein [Methylacidiphilum kamchatkense Kam1]